MVRASDFLNYPDRRPPSWLGLVLLLALLAGCASAPDTGGGYRVAGEDYVPLSSSEGFVETGRASWYGKKFHGRTTANGERYDMYGRTAAHKTLPFGTTLRVTNLDNGRVATARVNDRGPFVPGRIIDLTYTLAAELGFAEAGTANVRIEAAGLDPAAPMPAPSGPVSRGFAVQLGAFSSQENALKLAARVRPRLPAVQVVRAESDGITIHRVRVGNYESREEAEAALDVLADMGIEAALVALN